MHEQPLHPLQQREPVGAQRRVVGHHHHGVEEGVHRVAQHGERLQRHGVIARRESRLHLARDRLDLLAEDLLRRIDEALGVHALADRLIDPAEQILGEQVEAIARQVEPKFTAREYTGALKSLAVLRDAVDAFFDSVMVMADDAALRANRLALLKRIQELFMHAADLSRLPG